MSLQEPLHRIFIPLQPPSQNALRPSPHSSKFWVEANLKKVWGRWIPPLISPKRATSARWLIVTRLIQPRGRPYDQANLVGGLKPILDMFVLAGYLKDDSSKWLSVEYRQRRPSFSEAEGTWFEFFEAGCNTAPENDIARKK